METTDKNAARRRRAYWFLLGAVAILGAAVLVGTLAAFALRLREAARNERCDNNLRRIYQAFAEYADVNGAYPPAFTVDAEGRKLHSWRVLLLPYLDEEALFAQIRLDEPWDSDWNSQFHSQTPNVFKCASTPETLGDKSRRCAFSVVVGESGETGKVGGNGERGEIGKAGGNGGRGEIGKAGGNGGRGRTGKTGENGETGGAEKLGASGGTKGTGKTEKTEKAGEAGGVGKNEEVGETGVETAFRADGTSVAPEDLRDGAANTVLCVERKSPVCWMAPDVELTASRVLAENEKPVRERVDFGSWHGRGANALFFDGSTRFLSEKLDGGVLRLLLGIADSAPENENGEASESEPSSETSDGVETSETETTNAESSDAAEN